MKKFQGYIPLVIVAALVFIFAMLTPRAGDSLRYEYIFPGNYEENFTRPISSVADIFESQINHYQTVNGRVTVHSLVQIFCGLLPEKAFPFADAVAWILFIIIIGRLADVDFRSFRQMVILSSLCWLTSAGMDFDPPIQINYFWAGVIVFGWLYLFLRKGNMNSLLLFISGCIAGSCHEGFSIPVGAGLLYFIISERKQIAKGQLWGFAGFALGSLFLILAPGNFHRLSLENVAESSFANGIEQILPALLFPAVLIVSYISLKKRRKISFKRVDRFSAMLLIIAAVSLLIGIYFKFRFGPRGIFTASVSFIILSLRLIDRLTYLKQVNFATLLVIISIQWIFWGVKGVNFLSNRYHEIERVELLSTDGRIFIADSLLPPDYRLLDDQLLALSQVERPGAGHHGYLRLLPESAKSLTSLDTNMSVEFRPQAWIILQSKRSPRKFRIEKRILPSFIPLPLTPRDVDFSDSSDLLVDTAGPSRIAVYVNERFFIDSKIVMSDGKE